MLPKELRGGRVAVGLSLLQCGEAVLVGQLGVGPGSQQDLYRVRTPLAHALGKRPSHQGGAGGTPAGPNRSGLAYNLSRAPTECPLYTQAYNLKV